MATGTPIVSQPEVEHKAPPADVQLDVRIIPRVNSIMADAYEVIAHELRFYARRTREEPDRVLDGREAYNVAGHVRSLVLLAEEERKERELTDALSQLDDKQLLRLVSAAQKQLKGSK